MGKGLKTRYNFLSKRTALIVGFVLLLFISRFFVHAPPPFLVEGRAKVIDGDSLIIEGQDVRLKGIDAPEGRQTCFKKGGTWNCGRESARRLRQLTRGKHVFCDEQGRDKYDRILGICYIKDQAGKSRSDININEWMVENGWAVSFGDYYSQESHARSKRSGLWQGQFDLPKDWRRANRQSYR